jgi:hypothetical protein
MSEKTTEQKLADAQARIAELEEQVAGLELELEGHDDDCFDAPHEGPHEAVDTWLTRQVGLGLISAEGRAAVELLLGDLS